MGLCWRSIHRMTALHFLPAGQVVSRLLYVLYSSLNVQNLVCFASCLYTIRTVLYWCTVRVVVSSCKSSVSVQILYVHTHCVFLLVCIRTVQSGSTRTCSRMSIDLNAILVIARHCSIILVVWYYGTVSVTAVPGNPVLFGTVYTVNTVGAIRCRAE